MRSAEEVQTERLFLRQFRGSDLDRLAEVFADDRVMRFPLGRGLTGEETAAMLDRMIAHWEQHGFGLWAAVPRSTDTLIGFIGLAVPAFLPAVMPAVEVGWRLDPAWWGKGLATEGARASLAYGFDVLGLDEVISIAQPENEASVRVMHKVGMRFSRDAVDPKHGVGLVVYSIDRATFEASS